MLLYTLQSLKVAEILSRDDIYIPSWDKVNCFDDHQDKFEFAYRFILEQYNLKKNTSYTNPLVWWFTTYEQIRECIAINEQRSDWSDIIITAKVPDHYIMFHNLEDWYSVLGNYSNCHHLLPDDTLTYKQEEIFERIWKLYRKEENYLAMRETWKHIFHYRKGDLQKNILHANTPFIKKAWITRS